MNKDSKQMPKNLTWEYITNHPELDWDYKLLSSHSCITWEIIRDNPEKNWNVIEVMKNSNITLDIIFKNERWFFTVKKSNEFFDIIRDKQLYETNKTIRIVNETVQILLQRVVALEDKQSVLVEMIEKMQTKNKE
jgi:hypothetical protein